MPAFNYIFGSFLPRVGKRYASILKPLSVLLIAGLLIGVKVLFFTPGPPTISVGNNTLSIQKDGLQLSATIITPGPYFLREILNVNFSVTNHTHNTVYAGSPFTESSCGYFPGIDINDSGKPDYQFPIELEHDCPPITHFESTPVQPGKSITAHTYAPLLKSGSVMLKMETNFFERIPHPEPHTFPFRSIDPFNVNGQWPAIQLQVSSAVPDDRQIMVEQKDDHVSIKGPQGALANMLYAFNLACGDIATGDMTETGSYAWEGVKGGAIAAPKDSYCAGKKVTWTYAFASPGYALAPGTLYTIQNK